MPISFHIVAEDDAGLPGMIVLQLYIVGLQPLSFASPPRSSLQDCSLFVKCFTLCIPWFSLATASYNVFMIY